MNGFFTLGAFELADKIRNKEFTSQEVVSAHISQIKKVNKELNAMVEARFEQALMEAAHIDALIAANNLPADMVLAGVPCTIKEMIAVNGMKSTHGSIHRKKDRRDYDASLVERIKKSGAIIIATTNVPEVGFWFECDNPVYGETNNPYDTTRTSGGSSGGEAALIAAQASPFGLGSDIGGSIRIPAGFCGVYGHKPSDKLVPMTGHSPIDRKSAANFIGENYPFTVMGPMARKAKDLYPLLQLMLGPDSYDKETKKDFKLKAKLTDLNSLKVYYSPNPQIYLASDTDQATSDAIKNAARYLEQMGATIEELPADFFEKGFEAWQARAQGLGSDFKKVLTLGKRIDYMKEFSLLLTQKRNYTLPALLTAYLEEKTKSSPQQPRKSILRDLKNQFDKKMFGNTVLLFPNHPRPAFKKGSSFLRPFDFIYTGIFNAIGAPSTTVPMATEYVNKKELPIAIQIAAKEDHDHLTLSVAEILAEAFRVKPPPIS